MPTPRSIFPAVSRAAPYSLLVNLIPDSDNSDAGWPFFWRNDEPRAVHQNLKVECSSILNMLAVTADGDRQQLTKKEESFFMPQYKTKEEVMRLAFKLKALGEHSETPPHEAMLALEKMRALIFKHGITEAELHAHRPAAAIIKHIFHKRSEMQVWERGLASVLADFCGCVCLVSKYGFKSSMRELEFHGTATDVEFACYLFHTLRKFFLDGARNALFTSDFFKSENAFLSKSRFTRSFCVGCTHALQKLIDDITTPTMESYDCKALAISKASDVMAHLVAQKGAIPVKHLHHKDLDMDAVCAGIRHGRKSNLSRPLEEHTSPQPELAFKE